MSAQSAEAPGGGWGKPPLERRKPKGRDREKSYKRDKSRSPLRRRPKRAEPERGERDQDSGTRDKSRSPLPRRRGSVQRPPTPPPPPRRPPEEPSWVTNPQGISVLPGVPLGIPGIGPTPRDLLPDEPELVGLGLRAPLRPKGSVGIANRRSAQPAQPAEPRRPKGSVGDVLAPKPPQPLMVARSKAATRTGNRMQASHEGHEGHDAPPAVPAHARTSPTRVTVTTRRRNKVLQAASGITQTYRYIRTKTRIGASTRFVKTSGKARIRAHAPRPKASASASSGWTQP